VSPADKKWPHNFACELDAMAPDDMRLLVENVINKHLSQNELQILKVAEKSERELAMAMVAALKGGTAS
jgi:hypothetical protein